MAHATALVETLKRELRARRITYSSIARHLAMSEVSVKRMFSKKEFNLSRLDRICELAKIEFSDLARTFSTQEAVITRLTYEQEKEFVDNHKLMLVALCVLNHWSYQQILAMYELTPAECVRLLARLDKLKFIELLPENRYRLLVSRAFGWIPDGPIMRIFKEYAHDFLKPQFDRDNELLLVASGTLSQPSVSALLARTRKLAADFAEMRNDDAALPATERLPMTLMLGVRSWEPAFLRKFRRTRPAKARVSAP